MKNISRTEILRKVIKLRAVLQIANEKLPLEPSDANIEQISEAFEIALKELEEIEQNI